MVYANQKPSFVSDALLSVMDDIERLADPAVRLAAYAHLLDEVRSRVLPARDRTAYEARRVYLQKDIQRISGSDAKEVYYWCDRDVKANRLDRLPPRRDKDDLSDAIDIRDALALDRSK